jgi:hypothetical protein
MSMRDLQNIFSIDWNLRLQELIWVNNTLANLNAIDINREEGKLSDVKNKMEHTKE